ncbi:hypothetical protein [Flavobacterium sp. SM2513]|uniref:hypothetical protein n=1 Tax=Flavobacterium sp. SM2513 TaxID=3424766 RepID=UPI003D7F2D20
MASTSETGHAILIANAGTLNIYSKALEDKYNPSNAVLKIDKMEKLQTEAFSAQKAVNINLAPYSNAVDARELIFMPFNKNLTKLQKAYKATDGVGPAQIEDLNTRIRLLKGKRKPGEKKDKTPEELEKEHSVSQMSYTKRTDNMDGLISILENTPNYSPNEDEFKVATYQAKKDAMLDSTILVNITFTSLNTARSNRDKILYTQAINLVDTCNKQKDYLLSILETQSPEYKAISRLKFKTPSLYKKK